MKYTLILATDPTKVPPTGAWRKGGTSNAFCLQQGDRGQGRVPRRGTTGGCRHGDHQLCR